MLLLLAAAAQVLLLSELLLRRVLYLVFPARRTAVQRFADTSVLSSLAAALLQAATVPLQAAASLLAGGARVWATLLLLGLIFATLLILSNSSVYVYRVLAQMYNTGVAPVVGATKWLLLLLDFGFRLIVPVWNGWIYLAGQILRRVILPYSFSNVDVFPELLQALTLAFGTLGQSILTWLENVTSCTVLYEVSLRSCAGNLTRGSDCGTMFSPVDARCYAAPNHLSIDLLTPGLFARQAAQSVQGMIADSCGVVAIVLNLALFPLGDDHLYAAVHAGFNAALFTLVGLPVSTMRRCQAMQAARGLRPVHVQVACTPDWQPPALMAETALLSLGSMLDNWLNAAAVLVDERVSGRSYGCERSVPLKQIVLDAARAIEGLESLEALERLQGRGGQPEGETLRSVRVVGLTPRLFGVTDGKSVLYRSPHDGYVLAFGAWPFHVDVRYGLAAVTYGGGAVEADSDGSARTGLLGCRCVEAPEFTLLCSTAPYVQHIDDDLAGLNASSVHRVAFPNILLTGMTCQNTAVRVMPLRWPRRRLATAQGGGSGFTGYDRFSFQDTVNRYTGDGDVTDNLRLLAARERVLPSGAVEAVIYVQPVCGSENSVTCAAEERDNCFPWCMAVVRGGRRAQNITMYNARVWEEHVVLPDVDCGVRRDSGAPCSASAPRVSLVDLAEQVGVVRARCTPDCTPASVPGSVLSLVPLDAENVEPNSSMALLQANKNKWLAVRMKQPVVVAGEVMLGVSTDGDRERLVVSRLFDIGQSTLQMASERLTLTSNAHAVEVHVCDFAQDTRCVAQAMQEGKVVLPPAVRVVHRGAVDAGVVVPAAASRWAVHWAQNPEVSVYNSLFEFCRNATPSFSFAVHSSYSRARVWTLQTMRAVDLEEEGSPSTEQIKSRISYMTVPYFLGKDDFSNKACDKVVGLQIVGVEFLNDQNVLVTVLAARPQDYNPSTGRIEGSRIHRYYYLHPGRNDCVSSEDGLEGNPAIFSCWRSQASGMWPDDDLVTDGVWQSRQSTCVRPRALPLFGTYLMMPFVAYVRIAETMLDAICTFAAVLAADADTSSARRALDDLFTVQLKQSTFHASVDSAGARFLRVDSIIAAAEWAGAFHARLASYVVNALAAVSSGNRGLDKTMAGVRTLVIGAAKVYEGLPAVDAPFATVENMFREPIAYSSLHASVAVLTMADGLKEGVVLPAMVRAFMAAQLQLVSTFALVLRLSRVIMLRMLQALYNVADGPRVAASVSAALVESRPIIENEYLNIMRFQCYGFAQMVGSDKAWGQALRHMCLLLPDTLEGVMHVGTVLSMEYPVVACACKLTEGEARGTLEDTVTALCLQRPLPAESVQWLLHLHFETADTREVCFAAMDSANTRFHTAFDKTYKRMYQMTKHAAQITDGLLGIVTGDTVACDAFDVSPYVLSIIPEPVDYFASCVHTDDCAGRCYDEFTAFEQERLEQEADGTSVGFSSELTLPLESLIFSLDSIEQGTHRPPFNILDAVEIPSRPCRVVCGLLPGQRFQGNRCLLVAGVRGLQQPELAVAYYCLPIDITQHVFEWSGMEASTLPPANSSAGFPAFYAGFESLRAVFVVSSWAAENGARDSVIAVVDEDDSEGDANFAPRLTRVYWCVPGLPRREIYRSSTLAERQLGRPPDQHHYLHAIEHVQVDVADSEEQDVTVRVYGLHMEPDPESEESKVRRWTMPVIACVQCTFPSSARSFAKAQCDPCSSNDAEAEFKHAQEHVRVCLRQEAETDEDSLPCAESIALPTQRSGVGGFVTRANPSIAVVTAAGVTRRLEVASGTLKVLQNGAENGAFMDAQNHVHARTSIVCAMAYPQHMQKLRSVVANSTGPGVELELITVNAQRSQGAWIHVLALNLDARSVDGAERRWLRATTTAPVHMNCSIHTCGACAQTRDGQQPLRLQQLENLCYAAQQCGIERCAGTLVNMRKPLCNLGNVLTSELHAVRVLLQGLWTAIADNVAMIVELTHARRQEYQIKWPEKLVRQEACTAKDTLVSFAATITSIFGAFSHLMQDVTVHNGFVGSNVDSRVHARYIMVLAATTNLISSVIMWPLYQGLVLQKFFACTVNDVLYNIDTLVADGQPTISIRFGDPRAAQAIENAGIAVCLSDDVRQSLQDAGVRVRNAGQAGDATALRVVRKLSDAISNTVDVGLSAYVQYAYHVMDIWLAWGASVIRGMMDVAQTADFEHCKLPVVDTGLQSLGLCACGDEPHAIPAAEKSKTWTQHAFWCSGLLMLNGGDGSDLIVWNPYSLQQLLALKGEKGQGYADFVQCLRDRWQSSSSYYGSTCEEYKPRDQRLQRQGVEVLQLITRCRGNYQQGRWDEASTLLALFEAAEWQNLRQLRHSPSARKDDKYTRLRKHVVQLLDSDADMRSENALILQQSVLDCLQDALRAGVLQHTCFTSFTSFAYDRAPAHEVDACRVPSGEQEASRFPLFLWTGNSRNHVPLAKLHPTNLGPEALSARAEKDLQDLLAQIDAEFAQLFGAFSQEFQQKVEVESFSTEGDELHQLIDCIVMGPYSAADLNTNMHSDSKLTAEVPQYHRGNPASREFSSWGETGGSSARKHLMRSVFDFVNEKADDILTSAVDAHLQKLVGVWLDADTYRCKCADNQRKFECCTGPQSNDELLQSVLENSLNIDDSHILTETYSQIVNSHFLTETLWTRRHGDSVPLEPAHRQALHAVHLFKRAGREPVRTYGVEDTAVALNEASLWETCTSRVAGLFATLPFTEQDVNLQRQQTASTVHVPPGFLADFDPSVASAEDRVHSMELLVDAVLERSRQTAPHFWTHAHRYVASDSVWCERANRTFPEPPSTTTPTSLKEHGLRTEAVLAPGPDQLLYPADVLQACACGWQEAEGTCYIPAEVCTEGIQQLGDARLADGRSKREVWTSLCQGGVPAQPTASRQESSSYDPASNRCPAGTRVETPKLKSSSCAAEGQGTSTLCNCHKFDDGIIQMGGFDGYHNWLRCRWVLSADVNISIQVTNWKTSSTEVFTILKAPLTVNFNPNDIVFQSIQSPLVKTFTLTLGNYVEVLFGPIQEPMGWDRGVNASWSTLQCVPCDAGQYSVTADSSCLPCERGKYSQIVGATACTDCPLGSYQPATGQSTCLPGTTYNSPADKLAVLQVLQDLDSSLLQNCSARKLSIAWGLLAPEEQEDWYSGSTRAWSVNAQHLATAGPGGLRVGMLAPGSSESLQEYVRGFELGERVAGTFNARHAHSIAQPVCEGTLREHLSEDLRRYFPDVFVPMAHAVQIVPPVEYCARWTLEHAMLYVLRKVSETAELPQGTLEQQLSSEALWKTRCAAQMHEVALCALRGVYDIVPNASDVPASAEPAAHCAFAGPAHTVSGCARRYYTSGCLLYCDGHFFDPCLCQAGECAPRAFAPAACALGRLADGRELLGADEVLLTSSLSPPADILPGEADNDTHWEALRQALQQTHAVSKLRDVDFDSIFELSAAELLQSDDEEATPHSYCDDLFDYWPDVQHPVGYHPSSACRAQASRTRGFDAWMSRNASGHALLDPARMRNMTLASQVFGAAHLVCDAHAYAAPGHRLNPYYMESRWDDNAQADPAVPTHAQSQTVDEMPTLGVPSYADTDTTLGGQQHTAERLMQHSVGLVRAWAQWFPLPGDAAEAQQLLDTRWPHWLPPENARGVAEHAGLFLGAQQGSAPLGCSFPRLRRCQVDRDCQGSAGQELKCLLNYNEDKNTREGVCDTAGRCYQHKHCASHQLCSGDGLCVEPRVSVVNAADFDAELQLFGRQGCDVSTQRLSRFERVPDFARANGMCSFRNWYHYRNLTANVLTSMEHVKSVPDGLVWHTDRADAQNLQELKVLETQSHPCDRDYAHTDFQACFSAIPAVLADRAASTAEEAEPVLAARTWKLDKGTWHAQFCSLQGGERDEQTGFLSPYPGALLTAARDIKRCYKLGLCPSTTFHVRGRQVEVRRVRVHVHDAEETTNVKAKDEARDYCGLDAQRCWAMGHLLGQDCAEVDEEHSTLCVVDELVVPLLAVAYEPRTKPPVADADFDSRLKELKNECPHAFAETIDTKTEVTLFRDVYKHLTEPYAWTDTKRRQKVLEYANDLFFMLFGVASNPRGINSVDKYLDHSKCAVFLARKLQQNQDSFAQEETLRGFGFYSSSGKDQVLPGASLYLFDRRLPLSVNLRWLLQCVVLAKDSEEGGALGGFLSMLNRGTLSDREDDVQCMNYDHDEKDPKQLKLSSWLRKAKFLFTQVPSQQLHALQISTDLFASIAKAVAQLPVLAMPDLTCVQARPDEDIADAFTKTTNPLSRLRRFRNPALNFDVGDQETDISSTQRIFEEAGSSVYTQVLQFLVKDTAFEGQDWTANRALSLQELENAMILKNMHIFDRDVEPTDMYPRYRYANLDKTKLQELYDKTQKVQPDLDSYTYPKDEAGFCTCTEAGDCQRRRLRSPEYSVSPAVSCEALAVRMLPCGNEDVLTLLDRRQALEPPYLTQDELLYLVLLIFDYEISYTASGGYTTLHRLRDPEQAQFVDDLFDVALPGGKLSLHEARAFNEYLEQQDVGSLKCPPQPLNYYAETNKRHKQLQQCVASLREEIGWRLPRGTQLDLQPPREVLHAGFFLAYTERVPKTFLDFLFNTTWTSSEHTSPENAICSASAERSEVMAPFWAEFFDVGSDDSADEPSLACDFEPSGPGSMLMVYDTLCSSSANSLTGRTCSQHPDYQHQLQNTLPPACARQDGKVVVRRRIGGLKTKRLCELKPGDEDGGSLRQTCSLKHGALHGHVGNQASKLDDVRPLAEDRTQRGFWARSNKAFRSLETNFNELTALAINEDDIAGHCLTFQLSAEGVLALRSAGLRRDCSDTALVSGWLAQVEQDWAWDHAHAAALHAQESQERVPWTCPLHWLQQYHDDGGRHQARSPSSQRNRARFRHITGDHHYAHPTVRHANRLRGLRAPRFLGDTLACVAPAERCHSAEHLNQTIHHLLQPEWRPVAYVPQDEQECTRTLDWPHDCGSTTPRFDQDPVGRCVLRT